MRHTVAPFADMPQNRVVQVNELNVEFRGSERTVHAVKQLSFHVDRGETLAVVGESGSGKSVTSLALMRLVEYGGGSITGGQMALRRRNGEIVDLAQCPAQQMRSLRGADLAMIFQEPMTSLNPVFPVGEQIAESIRLHQGRSSREARAEALRMLDQVRIPDAGNVLGRFPHQLSGGMRQRVMIAMALACKPALLIADEPTTALDVTVQAQILQLIRELQREMNMGVMFITHDMGVVAEMADRVLVMLRGEPVEAGEAQQVFDQPAHPYTRALLAAVPRLGSMRGTDQPARFTLLDSGNPASETAQPSPAAPAASDAQAAEPILSVRDLTTRFDIRTGLLSRVTRRVHAVEKVSFDLYRGETLSLVGESGCGKSTTGRSLLQLVQSQAGRIVFEGQEISGLRGTQLRNLRRNIQFVFQDPLASLDPRLSVGYSIMEPMRIHGVYPGDEAEKRMRYLLERVGLPADSAQRYPHEFSGGQRQRICIARALATHPKVVIADESVSALDVSIQAQIVNLLIDLQREMGMALLFISHDMAVVERISHRVAVMYLGQIVEIGSRRDIFENPQHAYTKRLMSAVPVADPRRRHLDRKLSSGEIPSPIRKVGDEPVVAPLLQVGENHYVAQHAIAAQF
ncbi:Glutathione import ATP-binding protein GsiA [Paraburkholderia caffeinitolerans]|uniref:Glutathione import ATP-binding protein GsiA n=1 Tax=Paraburkholderia caffeinitolerans TaxID=1723730 RepID=A0A6J5GFQ2_9BURK|nr:dipeptide ABC transporter ATP-binding protein [Paraburkholderia caffeinitolerans]CAB3799900.1 Glutathione import ATP-binding protein GsiA [Paraburkholderia caffeinitolerans]